MLNLRISGNEIDFSVDMKRGPLATQPVDLSFTDMEDALAASENSWNVFNKGLSRDYSGTIEKGRIQLKIGNSFRLFQRIPE